MFIARQLIIPIMLLLGKLCCTPVMKQKFIKYVINYYMYPT